MITVNEDKVTRSTKPGTAAYVTEASTLQLPVDYEKWPAIIEFDKAEPVLFHKGWPIFHGDEFIGILYTAPSLMTRNTMMVFND